MKAEGIEMLIRQENYFYNILLQIERLSGQKSDFSDLAEALESLSPEDLCSENIVIAIPKGLELQVIIEFIEKRFSIEICKEGFLGLKNDHVNSKNYVIVFPKDFDSQRIKEDKSYRPMTLLERVLLDTRIFLKHGSHLDAYLSKIPVCTGSVLWHPKPHRNKFPYMAWNVDYQKCFLEYTKEPESVFMAEGRVKIFGL